MRRPVLTFPDPILHEKAKPVDEITEETRALLQDMADTMYAEDGVGIAAPQVGVSLRLVCIDLGSGDERGLGLMKIVNPEIVSREGEIEWEEGCLSVPEFRRTMKRSAKLTVKYLDENGEQRKIEAEGLLAVAFQQEIDHLDGKLIIDDASRLKREIYLRKLKRSEKER